MGKITLIDKQDRKKLQEGRNYGIAFAFAKRDGDTYELVMPCSACKDYLNDQLYSEVTGKPYSAYGFNSKKTGCFKDGMGYLAVAVLDYHSGGKYVGRDKDEAYLEAHLGAVESFLRAFEGKLGIKLASDTTCIRIEQNRYLFIVPAWWLDATWKISLYSLLIRAAVEGRYVKGDIMKFLAGVKTSDQYHLTKVIPKVEQLFAGQVPVQDMTKPFSVHNTGIVNFAF
jgi:hypothetical protein